MKLDLISLLSRVLDQTLQLTDPRLRPQLSLLLVAAQHAHDAAHLDERVTAGLLDDCDRIVGSRQIAVEQALRRSALDDHRADAARDHSLELARDPCALVGDRETLAVLALGADQLGRTRELCRQLPAPADRSRDCPRPRAHAKAEHPAARPVRRSARHEIVHAHAEKQQGEPHQRPPARRVCRHRVGGKEERELRNLQLEPTGRCGGEHTDDRNDGERRCERPSPSPRDRERQRDEQRRIHDDRAMVAAVGQELELRRDEQRECEQPIEGGVTEARPGLTRTLPPRGGSVR